MKIYIHTAISVLILVFITPFSEGFGQKVLIGYVGAYHGQPISINEEHIKKLTHLNYAFANVIEGKVVNDPSMSNDSLNFAYLNSLKKHNKDLKVLVSVGGWGWSGGFSDAALDSATREIFANSAIEFILLYNLDGIDIDWEYPGLSGNNNTFREEDGRNYTLVIKMIREKLDSIEAKSVEDRKYLITIATGASEAYINKTELGETQQYLDYINIMTYDYYGTWTTTTGHHASLNSSKENPNGQSTIAAIDRHAKAGIPRNKIVVGIAFYGHGWTGVIDQKRGMFQKYEGQYNEQSLSYTNISNNLKNQQGFKYYFDKSAKASFLWNADKKIWISYEDIKDLKAKADYILENDLAGAMFWQYYSDSDGELLDVLYKKLIK